MKTKIGIIAAILIGVNLLGFMTGYFYAQYQHEKEQELRAIINANGIAGVLYHLEHGKTDYARGLLFEVADEDMVTIKAYDGINLGEEGEKYKLRTLKKLYQLRKKYPRVSLPELVEMHKELDTYLEQKVKATENSLNTQ